MTLNRDVERETLTLKRVEAELRKVIVGQDYLLDRLLAALLARGHVLIEGVPGLAKTLAVKTLAQTLALQFQRIQFTPDLLPADLIGTLIYDQRTGDFLPRRGPVFTHLLLADEINRAPAKVQSALLEAMEERQVTLGDRSHPLPDPFMVLATQNPIEQEGTYPLAEAQMDRFMMKLRLGYPSRAEESEILDRMLVERELHVSPVLEREHLVALRSVADAVYLDPKIRGYVLDLVQATREPRAAGLADLADLIAFGASWCGAAATSSRRTSRRWLPTSCATASSQPTKRRPRRSPPRPWWPGCSSASRCPELSMPPPSRPRGPHGLGTRRSPAARPPASRLAWQAAPNR